MAQVVEVLVEGGKASPPGPPPLGPAIGPLGLNVKQVVDEINKATKEFEGMQVPVKIIVEDPKKKTSALRSVSRQPVSLSKKSSAFQRVQGNPVTLRWATLLWSRSLR